MVRCIVHRLPICEMFEIFFQLEIQRSDCFAIFYVLEWNSGLYSRAVTKAFVELSRELGEHVEEFCKSRRL